MQMFEDRIERIPIGGCWIWMGSQHHSGYGRIKVQGKEYQAHRWVYCQVKGITVPSDKKLCHHCDNPICVNPEHMFIGSQKDNIDDMDQKGRRVRVPGEANGRTHLTEADVRSIREDTRTIKAIAKAYNIGKSQVSNIKSRYSWKHI